MILLITHLKSDLDYGNHESSSMKDKLDENFFFVAHTLVCKLISYKNQEKRECVCVYVHVRERECVCVCVCVVTDQEKHPHLLVDNGLLPAV